MTSEQVKEKLLAAKDAGNDISFSADYYFSCGYSVTCDHFYFYYCEEEGVFDPVNDVSENCKCVDELMGWLSDLDWHEITGP